MAAHSPSAHHFDSVTLLGYPSFEYLVDALSLYRDVTIMIDDDDDFICFTDQFGPAGLVSFLDEFHESVHVDVLQGGYFNIGSSQGAITTIKTKFYDYDNSFIAYRRAHMAGGRLMTYLPSSLTRAEDSRPGDYWEGPGSERAFRRFRTSVFDGMHFIDELAHDEGRLSQRFNDYLSRLDNVKTPGVRIAFDNEDWYWDRGTVSRNVKVVGHHQGATAPDLAFREFINSLCDEQRLARANSTSNLILRDRGADFILSDYDKLMEAHTGKVMRDLTKTVVIPNMPSMLHEPRIGQRLPEVSAARHLRLSLPSDIGADDLLIEMSRIPWYQKLPTRTARFAFFTGAGIGIDLLTGSGGAGTAAGVALGGYDAFLLDRLLEGFRPNLYWRYRDSLARVYST